MTLEEAVEAIGAEPGGTVGGGKGVEEVEGDGAADVGEDAGGTGPEGLQQAAELIGELDARGDQVVAGADGGAKGLGLVRRRTKGTEAMAVGAEDVGEDVGVAGIALGEGGTVARTCGLEGVGVNRYDGEAGFDERVDEEARGALDGDGQLRRLAEALESADQIGEALAGCGRRRSDA